MEVENLRLGEVKQGGEDQVYDPCPPGLTDPESLTREGGDVRGGRGRGEEMLGPRGE